ncbi:6-phosphofructokinase [Sansalvadorimonas sp. 2012CJ34-2]|uniref:ATP-dependent 6-phosphofructokinase n=1 Tax=Parendozoicomonas callyspongiae TaxID=2942213 RepID=A0ABT0PE76_9GAMM|nr:6-phosphofructokinase [Sansalvadorimonas sp. 2012CJ34-2]MCL6269688.1 6-phosphofructokinase [Sansalvadorimonas sp. 2012CJ34-2]
MSTSINHIGVLTSGGDAPGMNAAVRAVVRCAIFHDMKVTGIVEGYTGLLTNTLRPLNTRSVSNIINQGGTFLKSSRCMEFYEEAGRAKAAEKLHQEGIQALVVIGGDGTFTGATLLAREQKIPVVGIPGTIDNDIYGTDFTIGFDTAINTAVEAVDKIRDTATSHNRLFFIEVMGRDAGYIALHAGIGAGSEEILIPEQHRGLDYLLDSLDRSNRAGKTSSIVIVAEGDKSNSVLELAKSVEEKLPEYSARVTILGHLQRGGRPTCFDRVLASRLGVAAVDTLRTGSSGVMVGLRDNRISLTGLEKACKETPDMDPELIRVSNIVSI